MKYRNAAFYKFVSIDDPGALREALARECERHGLRGTILLAHEGLNAYFAGKEGPLAAFLSWLKGDPRFADIEPKVSPSDELPFRRMVVKVKREIVTMGREGIDPARLTGRYVKPLELETWLASGEDVLLVDTRNDYEVRLGTFEGAVDPGIGHFRAFPEWVERNLASRKGARIVTFCTGGIRCEKATAYMRGEGFEDVWQLEGGILKYLEETSARGRPSHWKGDCFVFDYRVAVGPTLEPANYALCYACRSPLSVEDRASPHYVYEKQCPYCVGKSDAKERDRARLRLEKERVFLQRRRARAARARKGARAADEVTAEGTPAPERVTP